MSTNLDESLDQTHVRFTLDAVIYLNGEDAQYIGQRLNSALSRAIADGALTGDTAATVDVYTAQTTTLTPEAAALDESKVDTWLSHQIESGSIPLKSVAGLMARYTLRDPAEMREELAERMQAESETTSAVQTSSVSPRSQG